MWLLYVHRIYSVMLYSFLIQSRWYKFDCFLSLPIYKVMYQHIFVDKLRIVKSTSCSNVMAVAQWRQMRQMPHFWNGKCNLWKQIKSSFFFKICLNSPPLPHFISLHLNLFSTIYCCLCINDCILLNVIFICQWFKTTNVLILYMKSMT
jgi:hypothetical protein